MGIITRGFAGRGRRDVDLPPGQYLTEDFPVLSAGPTPRVPLDTWELGVTTESGQRHTWSWAEMLALPSETVTVDIHCVTKWSKLGTGWRGVKIETLLEDVGTAADYVLAHSYGGYTTNVPLEDLLDGPGLDRVRVRRRPDTGRARWPGPAAGAAPVLLEERQVGTGAAAAAPGRAGLLGDRRLSQLR